MYASASINMGAIITIPLCLLVIGANAKHNSSNTDDVCSWAKHHCKEGEGWLEPRRKCVPILEADCAPSIFGEKAKLLIQNYKHKSFLTECRTCPNDKVKYFTRPKKVIGSPIKTAWRPWWQVLLAEKRGGNPYYSLAFNQVNGGKFKVISASSPDGIPMSKIYNKDAEKEGTGWRLVPVPPQHNKRFLIVSQTTGEALEMVESKDWRHRRSDTYIMKLAKPDFNNEAQMWNIHH